MSLDMGLLLAGAKERGELESRVTSLIDEIKQSGIQLHSSTFNLISLLKKSFCLHG
jgi:hypothetical protein